MTRRPLHVLLAILVMTIAGFSATPVTADVLHLRSGAAIHTWSWWFEDDQLMYESAAGTVGIPRVELARIEPSTVAPPGHAERDTVAIAPAVPSPAGSVDEQFVELANEGFGALRAREFETAADRLAEAIRLRPDAVKARVGYAVAEIALGRDTLALGAVLDGLVTDPEDPDLHELHGDLMNREERVDDALEAWRRAFSLAPNDRLREKIVKGERERTAARGLGYLSTPHFTVRYDGDRLDDDLAEEIVEILEDGFASLTRQFRHAPAQPITVLLYAERQFRDATLAPEWVGGLFDGKIRVPLGGLRRVDQVARALLLHELTHAFVRSKTRSNCPRWLHEGLAQRAEGRPPTAAERRDVRARLERTGAEAWDSEGFSYPAALSLVSYLHSVRGDRGLVRLLDLLGEGRDVDDALRFEYGMDYPALCRAWARVVAEEDDR